MKIYVALESPQKEALKKSLNLFDLDLEYVNAREANLIILESKKQLLKLYDSNQDFVVISEKEPENLPENSKWLPVTQCISGITKTIFDLKDEVSEEQIANSPVVQTGIEFTPENPENALKVLVIDDKNTNLQKALDLLKEDHFLTLAKSYRQGAELIQENNYDVVLADGKMPADTFHDALSTEAINPNETVPNGPFLMFFATQKGARFATVTKGDHHQDWFSAILDDLQNPQTVNGQPVLLINYLGKRWDKALDKLMSV